MKLSLNELTFGKTHPHFENSSVANHTHKTSTYESETVTALDILLNTRVKECLFMRLIIVPEKLSKGEKEEREFFLHHRYAATVLNKKEKLCPCQIFKTFEDNL